MQPKSDENPEYCKSSRLSVALPSGHNTDIEWFDGSGRCSGPGVWTWCWKDQPIDWRGWRGDVVGSAGETGSVGGALKTDKDVIMSQLWPF